MHNARTPRRPSHASRAFSLVELMVVLAIIAILASVTGFALLGVAQQARVSATKAQMSQVSGAVKTFYARNGSYPPPGQEGLQLLVTRQLLEPNTIKDTWGNDMDFLIGFEGYAFAIESAGPDRLWEPVDDNIIWTSEGDWDELNTPAGP